MTGERRFLGLFTSARLHRVGAAGADHRASKIARRSWSGRGSPPTATRARTCSRSWRPTRATSCSRPTPTTSTRSRPRCCTCRSGARPGCSCAGTSTAGSCPAWSTSRATATPPPCGCGWRASCARAFDGASVDYTTRVSESVLARLHFVVRVAPGPADPRRRRGRAAAPAGRRDPHLGRGPGRGRAQRVRRGGRRAPGRALRPGLPRGLQGGLHARGSAWSDLRHIEALDGPRTRSAQPLPGAGQPTRTSAGSSSTDRGPLSLTARAAAVHPPRRRGRRRAALRDGAQPTV